MPDYVQQISVNFNSPIAGLRAYTGNATAGAYRTSEIDLGNFVSGGDSFQVRFHQADDSAIGRDGWFIDDLTIFSSTIPEPGSLVLLAVLSGIGLTIRRR